MATAAQTSIILKKGKMLEAPKPLIIEFDNIANAPVASPAIVADWNTFFDLPTKGTPFLSVSVIGNSIYLIGGSNITIKEGLFAGNVNLISIDDQAESITSTEARAFDGCVSAINYNLPVLIYLAERSFTTNTSLAELILPRVLSISTWVYGTISYCANLISVSLPLVTNIGSRTFRNNPNLSFLNIPVCDNIGGNELNNNVFETISGGEITLYVKANQMTINGGNPDGDIQYLQANNTVTIFTV